jgi:hypothetical protein
MTRHTTPRSGGTARKLLTWLAIAALIYWIARDPAQAAAVFHAITRHPGHHGGSTRP